jgi:survival-of-motor-neuron-related-splicing factor 30
VKLPFSSLQAIPSGPYKSEQVQIGLQCQCKFATDLQFYAVTVTGITPYGYSVTYSDYGNVEEVPLEYLRPIATLAPSNTEEAASSSTSSSKDAKKDTLALIAIPENLQVLPTDTEEEKRRKYKKLKAIKNKNHQIQQEIQVKEVQQSWQKFVQKGTKRPLSGIGNKNSIFSSSEDTSSKIGVANSGRGMTQNFERKRFKFDGPSDDVHDHEHY